MGGDNEEKRGQCCQGTCIKDSWTKPKGGRIESGRWGWLGWWGMVGENGDNCTWTTVIKEKKHLKKIKEHNITTSIPETTIPCNGAPTTPTFNTRN